MAELFPKITAEAGGSTPWEFGLISEGSGNTFAPSTDQAYAGSYSYKAAMGGTTVAAYGIKSFTANDEVYFSARLFVSGDWNYSTSGRYTSLLVIRSASYALLSFVVLRPAGQSAPVRWQVYDRVNTTTTTTNFSLGAWHKVELYWKRGGSSNGIARVWVDGELIHEYTTLTTPAQDAASIRCGSVDDYNPTVSGCYVCVDDVEGYDEMPSGGGSAVPAKHRLMSNNNVRYA